MEPPGLKLIIFQGPHAGKTLDFKPGSTIRLGRIVRGNNLTIKDDDGISSKHFIIASKSAKWTIQDLDSSNGTTLNSTRLPPNTPVELHDNDTVKIGEYTSISVKLMTEILDESVKPRRNPRRQAATRVTRSRKDEVAVENSGLLGCEVIEIENNIGRKGRGRTKKEVPPESSEVEIEAKENLKAEQMPAQNNDVQIEGREDLKSEQMATQSNEVEIQSQENLKPEQISPESNVIQIDEEIMKPGKVSGGDVKRGTGEKVEEKEGDLERMTLGDWFDYLEGYLPKQIIEATEEMIERMRTSADRVHQYMKVQKKKGIP